MKIKSILISISFLLVLQVFGQKKINFGINAGITYSSLYGRTPDFDRSTAIGYAVGLISEYHINEKISAISNLNFERKIIGKQNTYTNDNGEPEKITSSLDFGYISLPILIQYNFKDNTGYYINSGVSVGYLIYATSKINELSYNITDFHKRYDFGFVASLGYKFSDSISIEIRNYLGLVNINKYPVEIENHMLKNHSIGIMLEYGF